MQEQKNILVVDDEPIIIMSAERVLSAEGYHVEGAVSGTEAMHRIEEKNYDVVLTDLHMLGVDGITLIKWIKKFRPRTGIVVITGHLFEETIKEALKLGIHDHMVKPISPAVLKDVINRTIELMGENGVPETEELPLELLNRLDTVISQNEKTTGGLVSLLFRTQEIFGYIPSSAQRRIAKRLNIYPAEMQSIISLHSCFRTRPAGRHVVKVCLGTSCYMKGGQKVLGSIKDALKVNPGQTTGDRAFTLEAVRCTGACGRGPVMVIDDELHGPVTRGNPDTFLKRYLPQSESGL